MCVCVCVCVCVDPPQAIPKLRILADNPDISIRVGIHTGPVIAGVVGITDPRCALGDHARASPHALQRFLAVPVLPLMRVCVCVCEMCARSRSHACLCVNVCLRASTLRCVCARAPPGCRYHLFGPTVDTAMQLERTGEKGRLHISGSTKDQLARCPQFIIKDAEGGQGTPVSAGGTFYVEGVPARVEAHG